MISIVLISLISLPLPKCPLWVRAMALGRKWAYEESLQVRLKRNLFPRETDKLDEEERRFLRKWILGLHPLRK